jgi:hypothetical protein
LSHPLIPAGLSVEQFLPTPDRVTIVTVPTPPRSACPLFGGLSLRAGAQPIHPHPGRPKGGPVHDVGERQQVQALISV